MKIRILIGMLFLLLAAGCHPRKESSRVDLSLLTSPVLFAGDSTTGFRDPAVLFENGRFYLFFTRSEVLDAHIYWYLVQTESDDLIHWTEPRRIVPNAQDKGYSGAGNVIRYRDEWLLCLSSYPRPGLTVDDPQPRYADRTARLYLIRSKDLENWSEPELLYVKGPDVPEAEMGRMIDPYIFPDKDEPGRWWCFYKQSVVQMAYTYDFKTWVPAGDIFAGDSVCVLAERNEYIFFHSAFNGVNIRRSRNLRQWTDWGGRIRLGQKTWDWARGRIKGASVLDLREVEGIEAYLMVFHGSGPGREQDGYFDHDSSIGIAWSKDLVHWQWPGKSPDPAAER